MSSNFHYSKVIHQEPKSSPRSSRRICINQRLNLHRPSPNILGDALRGRESHLVAHPRADRVKRGRRRFRRRIRRVEPRLGELERAHDVGRHIGRVKKHIGGDEVRVRGIECCFSFALDQIPMELVAAALADRKCVREEPSGSGPARGDFGIYLHGVVAVVAAGNYRGGDDV